MSKVWKVLKQQPHFHFFSFPSAIYDYMSYFIYENISLEKYHVSV